MRKQFHPDNRAFIVRKSSLSSMSLIAYFATRLTRFFFARPVYTLKRTYSYKTNTSYRVAASFILIMLLAGNGFAQSTHGKNTNGATDVINAKPVAIGHRSVVDANWKKGGRYEKFTPEQELLEKRDEHSKHFHYRKDTSSPWEDIRTDIRPTLTGTGTSYPLSVPDNKYQLFFDHTLDKGYMVRFPSGDLQLGGNGAIRLFSADNSIQQTIERKPAAGQVFENIIKYDNTYSTAYDELKVNTVSVDHDVILTQKPTFLNSSNAATVGFREFVKRPVGWKIVTNADYGCATCGNTVNGAKNLYIIDGTGKAMAKLNEPVIREQNQRHVEHNGIKGKTIENKTEKTTGEFTVEYAEGGAYIETRVPASWLADADRQYPVVIDPTLTCYPDQTAGWTGFSESSTACYCGFGNCGDYVMWEGTGTFIGWSYFNISSVPSSATVTDVTLFYDIASYDCPYFYINWMPAYTTLCTQLYTYETTSTQFVNVGTCSVVAGYNSNDLGATAAADLQGQVGSGIFGVAFDDYDASTTYYGEIYGYYEGNSVAPYIVVTYSVPPPPTGCNIGAETGPNIITPTGRNNGQVDLGP